MRISIPQEPDEKQLVGELSRNEEGFVFLSDDREIGPYLIKALDWEDARERAENFLYILRYFFSGAPLPPRMSHMEDLGASFEFDPSYEDETKHLLFKQLSRPSMILIDNHYAGVKEAAAKGSNGWIHVSSVVGEIPTTTIDGARMCLMSRVEVRNTGEITRAVVYVGRAPWIAQIAKDIKSESSIPPPLED